MLRLRTISVIGGGLFLIVVVLTAAAVAGLAELVGGLGSSVVPSKQAIAEIPADYLQLYQQAAATCPGLPWTVLAGVGRVESDHGRNAMTSSAGALGVMQMLPDVFAAYAYPIPPGGADPASPYDPIDAIYAAARDLCANGGRDGADIPGAIYAYNHDNTYVVDVLAFATAYGTTAPPSAAADAAVNYALAQLGTPYRWGGDRPGGFDCSGLTQAAYAAAGVTIPRTSEAQWSVLPHVPLDALQPGDLVFFNPGEFTPGLPGHVGIYIGNDQFIDAPHTGATITIDNLAHYTQPFGAARPTGGANGAIVNDTQQP